MRKPTPYIYQLTRYKDFVTYVQVNGVVHTIDFTGGYIVPYKYNGTFSTSDNDLIKAIEASPNFNSEYIRVSPADNEIQDIDDPELPTHVTAEIPIDKKDKEIQSIPGITSGQKARAYLLSIFDDLKSSDLRNNEIIISVASDKGISFPDWELV